MTSRATTSPNNARATQRSMRSVNTLAPSPKAVASLHSLNDCVSSIPVVCARPAKRSHRAKSGSHHERRDRTRTGGHRDLRSCGGNYNWSLTCSGPPSNARGCPNGQRSVALRRFESCRLITGLKAGARRGSSAGRDLDGKEGGRRFESVIEPSAGVGGTSRGTKASRCPCNHRRPELTFAGSHTPTDGALFSS
jgi:hypothetical protein